MASGLTTNLMSRDIPTKTIVIRLDGLTFDGNQYSAGDEVTVPLPTAKALVKAQKATMKPDGPSEPAKKKSAPSEPAKKKSAPATNNK